MYYLLNLFDCTNVTKVKRTRIGSWAGRTTCVLLWLLLWLGLIIHWRYINQNCNFEADNLFHIVAILMRMRHQEQQTFLIGSFIRIRRLCEEGTMNNKIFKITFFGIPAERGANLLNQTPLLNEYLGTHSRERERAPKRYYFCNMPWWFFERIYRTPPLEFFEEK